MKYLPPITILICLAMVLFMPDNKPDSIVAENVHQLRSVMRQCVKTEDGYPHIKTIYDAPEGQPRKPIRWEVTCRDKN